MLQPPVPIALRVDLPTPTRVSWAIEWRGHRWTDLDLTGRHLGVLAVLSGSDDWDLLDVPSQVSQVRASVTEGFMRLVNVLCAFVVVDATSEDMEPDEVARVVAESIDRVSRASVVEILGAFRIQS